MKINVTCIYWFLLLVSCVSSCLLFILVASESVKSTNSEIASDVNENGEINRYEGGENGAVAPDDGTGADLRTSFEEVPPPAENTDSSNEFVISQNSGLSDGLSDTGQAVVFTLVDTASAELKQRADTIPTTHITQSFNEAPNASTSSSLNFTPTILVQPPATATENSDVGVPENTANTPEILPKTTEDTSTVTNTSSLQEDTPNTQAHKEDYIVRAEPKIITTTKDEQPVIAQHNKTVTEADVQIPIVVDEVANKSEDKEPTKEENEDIPSFSEWTQKQLEEAEKKKEKALERNMSLSGQYLEELSRRYKKQVEDMQRAFEKKLTLLAEENKKREERELRLQQKIDKLTNSVDNLLTEKDSMWKTASLLGQFLLMEVFITCILLYFCWKTPEGTTAFQRQRKKSGTVEIKRRKSIDTIGHESPVVQRKRRPSEEALKISGTYEDLLITDEAGMTKAEKRRRRKKNALHRSQSAVACKFPQVTTNEEPTRRASSSDMNRKPTFVGGFQPNYVNGDLNPPAKIEEIPFVLEESEHTAVEPLNYFPLDKTDTISPDYIKTSLNKITKNGSIKILKSHNPLFKTALSSRNKRNSTSSKRLSIFKTDNSQNTNSSQSRKSQSPDPSIQNSYSVSDSQDDQTSLNSDTSKKDKKLSGFKKIFKRVFE